MDPDVELFMNYCGIHSVDDKSEKILCHIFIHHRAFEIIIRSKNMFYICKPEENKSISAANKSILNNLNKKKFKHPVQYLNALEAVLKNDVSPYQPIPTDLYRRVLHEFKEFRNFYIYLEHSEISADLMTITAKYGDNKHRLHTVSFQVNYDTSTKHVSFAMKECDLPIERCDEKEEEEESLINIFEKFVGTVEKYQHFFDSMDRLDQNCCVMDPAKPKRADCSRRIMLNEELSAKITLYPLEPTSLPSIQLIGAGKQLQEMDEVLKSNFQTWDDEDDVLEGLLKMFNLNNFPKNTNWESFMSCSICSSVRSETEQLIEIYCINEKCNQAFHTECLNKWLQQNVQFFDGASTGNCPYCKQEISTTYAPTLTEIENIKIH